MSSFELIAPRGEAKPLLIEIPHAGLQIPELVEPEIDTKPSAVLRDSDLYVDQLYSDAPGFGATSLVAKVSRFVVDLNRGPDEVDSAAVPKHPSARHIPARGVIWRAATDGAPLLRTPLRVEQFSRRLELFYRPYHDTLQATINRIRDQFGRVLVVAAHSMPSMGRRLPTGEHTMRADIVPGTRGRSTADGRVIDLIDAHFRDAGLNVKHDDPYRGGWTTKHYSEPKEGKHIVQIELNRALYVDEASSEIKTDSFGQLKTLLNELVRKLGDSF